MSAQPEPTEWKYTDSDIQQAALLHALKLFGAAALAGGGTRLAQELMERITSKPKEPSPTTIPVEFPEIDVPSEKTADDPKPMRSIWDWWVTYPAIAAALTGGGLLGYDQVKSMMSGVKKQDAEGDLESAKQDFEDAMLDSGVSDKTAGAKLGKLLDARFEQLEKTSSLSAAAMGTVATGGLALALAAHLLTYDRLSKSDPESLYKKIIEKQRRIRQAQSPLPIEFRMKGEPVDINQEMDNVEDDTFKEASKKDDDKDEDDKKDEDKETTSKGTDMYNEEAEKADPLGEREYHNHKMAADDDPTFKQRATDLLSGGGSKKIVDAAGQAASNPNGLKPVGDAINNPKVQEGMNEGTIDKVKNTLPQFASSLLFG